MPVYDVETIPPDDCPSSRYEPQQQLADGRWTPIQRCVRMDTDAGRAHILQATESGAIVRGPDERPMRQLVHGAFRMVHRDTGEVNPAVEARCEPCACGRTDPHAHHGPDEIGPAGPPPAAVVSMVDGLTATAQQLPDGSWSASFAELAEVVGTGATEAEARASARAQALELGALVAGKPALSSGG